MLHSPLLPHPFPPQMWWGHYNLVYNMLHSPSLDFTPFYPLTPCPNLPGLLDCCPRHWPQPRTSLRPALGLGLALGQPQALGLGPALACLGPALGLGPALVCLGPALGLGPASGLGPRASGQPRPVSAGLGRSWASLGRRGANEPPACETFTAWFLAKLPCLW